MVEPAVETAINGQLHAALSSPAVTDTLSSKNTELAKTDNGVYLFTSIMAKKPYNTRLRATLLTLETLCGTAFALVPSQNSRKRL